MTVYGLRLTIKEAGVRIADTDTLPGLIVKESIDKTKIVIYMSQAGSGSHYEDFFAKFCEAFWIRSRVLEILDRFYLDYTIEKYGFSVPLQHGDNLKKHEVPN